ALAIDVVLNDTDVDGDDLFVSGVDTTGTLGSVIIDPADNDQVIYDPNGAFEALAANETATDTFTYTVNDGNGGTDTATVTVTVTGENDPPVAVDDAGTVSSDSTVTIDLTLNDTDVDGDDLFVSGLNTTGLQGTVIIDPTDNDQVIYDPNGAFSDLTTGETATETFTYTVSDGNGGTDTATVTVTITGVNTPPVAVDDAAFLDQAQSGDFTVLANDSDPDGDAISTDSATLRDPGQGTVSVNPDGTINFTPVDTFTGTALIDYVILDTNGASATATLTVFIVPNTAPIIQEPVSFTVVEGNQLAADLLALDREGDTITWSIVGGPDADDFTIDPATGELTFVTPPSFANPVDADADNFYRLNVQAADQFGSSSQPILVRVVQSNTPPTAVNDVVFGAQGQPSNVDVLANDSDPDGDALSVDSVNLLDDTIGSVSINPDGTVNFTPNDDFFGMAVINYVASDGQGGTDGATLTVFVAQNQAPIIQEPVSFNVDEGDQLAADLLATDAEGDLFTWSISGGDDAALFSIDADTGELTFLNPPDFEAPLDADGDNEYRLDVTVTDQFGSSTAPILVTVLDRPDTVNSPPIITSPITFPGFPAQIALTTETSGTFAAIGATDPDQDTLQFTIFGEDVDSFEIDALTGDLTILFDAATAPTSFDGDFIYELDVVVSDGNPGGTAVLELELPLFTGA
ncbi:MAG: Ig-like domain-containing protein, partial [Pseudomonadota bacterium]